MSVELKYDAKSGDVFVSLIFPADEQVKRAGLEANVIEHHLLGQASRLCQMAGEMRLRAVDKDMEAKLDAEAAERKAAIDAEIAERKVAAAVTSDVAPTLKP